MAPFLMGAGGGSGSIQVSPSSLFRLISLWPGLLDVPGVIRVVCMPFYRIGYTWDGLPTTGSAVVLSRMAQASREMVRVRPPAADLHSRPPHLSFPSESCRDGWMGTGSLEGTDAELLG